MKVENILDTYQSAPEFGKAKEKLIVRNVPNRQVLVELAFGERAIICTAASLYKALKNATNAE